MIVYSYSVLSMVLINMNNTNIFIAGNVYGAGNIGDDGVLVGILRLLNRVAVV